MTTHAPRAGFAGLVDLASEALGGRALAANDDFFAEKENLVKVAPAIFDPDRYTDRGKWMDGWESRRRRVPGHDWCVVRLGVPGVVHAVDVDTAHFLGNAPAEASLEALRSPAGDPAGDPESWPWRPFVDRWPLRPGAQNFLTVRPDAGATAWTHVRLHIYPDGGVARLRIWGEPRPELPAEGLVDVAALVHGGRAVACSDMFFGRMENLIAPGRPANMGEGWETRRRRGPGHDWIIVRLAALATIERIEADTTHFKGNYPDRCSIDACRAEKAIGPLDWDRETWWPLVAETKMAPDQTHAFTALLSGQPCDHVRLNVYPDGGVARLRVWGRRA